MKLKLLVAVICALNLSTPVVQAAEAKPEDLIKARQAAYAFIAWNSSRIKNNLEASASFNKDEVIKAANAIQAIANSGLGSLYVKGTETGVGFHDSRVKAEAFDPTFAAKLAEVAGNFNREANVLAQAAATGDKETVQARYSKFTETCKGCHENFRLKNPNR